MKHVAFSSKDWSWLSQLLRQLATTGVLLEGEALCTASLMGAGLVTFTTSGQETEWVYSLFTEPARGA